MKFDLEKTKRLIKEGKSYASVLRGLNLEINSTLNKKELKSFIKEQKISTDHFTHGSSKLEGHDEAHPVLQPLLKKYDVSYEDLVKQCWASDELKEKRSKVVSHLHRTGLTWNQMSDIIGKSVGWIGKYTRAAGNKASKKNKVESARRVGKSRKGEKKPWLSKRMKQDWKRGKFDFHKGRERPKEEVEKMKASFSEERRQGISDRMKKLWGDPEYRENLMKFHTSENERERRSKAQARRMWENPESFC